MRILFMGTPDFALFSLRALVESGENVIGVITQPDKPKGRGYALTPPPVKVYALEKGLPVWQPTTLRSEEFAALLHELDPELIVVVAYGKILPVNVLEYPKHGCINVHGSLLPEYRGAAPMQRAILDGKKQTGITTMLMADGIDTGDMLLKTTVEIEENDNFEIIHDKLGIAGAQLLLDTVNTLRSDGLTPIPQDHTLATYAAKIEKEDCRIDFSRSAADVHNQIRGLSPIPLAVTKTPSGKLIKIVTSELTGKTSSAEAGQVVSTDGGILVACGDGGVLKITRVVPEGRSKMDADAFVRGRGIEVGDKLAWQ